MNTEKILPTKTEFPLWNAGYVKYIDHMGNDDTPLYAARMSTLNPTGVDVKKDDGLREYLWRHGHHSVFEQAILSVEVQVPLFIARQILRHRTLSPNEHSQRYAVPINEYYVQDFEDIKSQNDVDKQCSDGELPDELRELFLADARDQKILSSSRYQKFHQDGNGVAREMCRIFEPVSSYTRIYLTSDLRNWFNFLRLRLAKDAQKEIREVAEAIFAIIKELFPKCAQLFLEYTINGKSFGEEELRVIKNFMCGIGLTIDDLPDSWSKRNKREFMQKLGMV